MLRKPIFRETLLLHLRMLEHGIIPYTRDLQQPSAYLKTIPKDEARAIKRRFRKLFRRAMRQKAAHMRKQGMDSTFEDWWKHTYGIGLHKEAFNRRIMKARRAAVRTVLTIDIIRERDGARQREK